MWHRRKVSSGEPVPAALVTVLHVDQQRARQAGPFQALPCVSPLPLSWHMALPGAKWFPPPRSWAITSPGWLSPGWLSPGSTREGILANPCSTVPSGFCHRFRFCSALPRSHRGKGVEDLQLTAGPHGQQGSSAQLPTGPLSLWARLLHNTTDGKTCRFFSELFCILH